MPRKPLRSHIHLDSHQSLVASLGPLEWPEASVVSRCQRREITILIGFQLRGFGQSHLRREGSAVFSNTLDTSPDAYMQARANFSLES
jgi:hypothetical protein